MTNEEREILRRLLETKPRDDLPFSRTVQTPRKFLDMLLPNPPDTSSCSKCGDKGYVTQLKALGARFDPGPGWTHPTEDVACTCSRGAEWTRKQNEQWRREEAERERIRDIRVHEGRCERCNRPLGLVRRLLLHRRRCRRCS